MNWVVVIEQTEPVVVVTAAQRPITLEVGHQGPAGPPATDQTATAATVLGGHRVVTLNADGEAEYADPSDPATYGTVVGITTGAALAGAAVQIRSVGQMIEPSWSWTPGDLLFLGTDGTITATPPTSGIL